MFLTFSQTPPRSIGPAPDFTSTRSYATDVFVNAGFPGYATVNHALGTKDITVAMYSTGKEWVLPSSIEPLDLFSAKIGMEYLPVSAEPWRIVVGAKAKGFGLGLSGYFRSFTQADIVGDVLKVEHLLGSSDVFCMVYGPDGEWYDPLRVIVDDTNNVTISFLFVPPMVGTWKVVVVASTPIKGNVKGASLGYKYEDLVGESFIVLHGLSSVSPVIQVYDDNGEAIVPSGIKVISPSVLSVNMAGLGYRSGKLNISILAVV
jgi:hypothetical protein